MRFLISIIALVLLLAAPSASDGLGRRAVLCRRQILRWCTLRRRLSNRTTRCASRPSCRPPCRSPSGRRSTPPAAATSGVCQHQSQQRIPTIPTSCISASRTESCFTTQPKAPPSRLCEPLHRFGPASRTMLARSRTRGSTMARSARSRQLRVRAARVWQARVLRRIMPARQRVRRMSETCRYSSSVDDPRAARR